MQRYVHFWLASSVTAAGFMWAEENDYVVLAFGRHSNEVGVNKRYDWIDKRSMMGSRDEHNTSLSFIWIYLTSEIWGLWTRLCERWIFGRVCGLEHLLIYYYVLCNVWQVDSEHVICGEFAYEVRDHSS